MDPRIQKGLQYFDESEYFEAHEIWEEVWTEESGARHAFLQCLIQVAVAMHHASNSNWKGTRKLCASALGYLEKGRVDSDPVDLDALKEKIIDFEISVQAVLRGETVQLPFFKMPLRSGN